MITKARTYSTYSSAGAGATVSGIKGSNRALALPLDGSDLHTQLDPETVKLFFEGRIEIRGRRVFILS